MLRSINLAIIFLINLFNVLQLENLELLDTFQ